MCMADPPPLSPLCSSLQYKYIAPVLNCCSHCYLGKLSKYCSWEKSMFQQDKLLNSDCTISVMDNDGLYNSRMHSRCARKDPGRHRHRPFTTLQLPLEEQPSVGKLPFSGSAFSMHDAVIISVVPLGAMVSGYMVLISI